MGVAEKQVVLSLFPGADLFGKAFESRGFCVVRGPELLLGQDIRDFHAPAGRFDGVIGGPPCQFASTASGGSSTAEDLIGEFRRVAQEAQPQWIVMENLVTACRSPHIDPSWIRHKLRDWDCGGMQHRKRVFFFWPQELGLGVILPAARPGKPEYSLLASDWRTGDTWPRHNKRNINITLDDACEIQGFPGLLKCKYPMTKNFGIHLLGNGVPRAMGEWVADQVVRWLKSKGK